MKSFFYIFFMVFLCLKYAFQSITDIYKKGCITLNQIISNRLSKKLNQTVILRFENLLPHPTFAKKPNLNCEVSPLISGINKSAGIKSNPENIKNSYML